MPLAFLSELPSGVELISTNHEESNLLGFIKSLEGEVDDDTTEDFNLSLDLDIRIRRNQFMGTPVQGSHPSNRWESTQRNR